MRVPSRARAMVKISLSNWLGKSAFKTALDIKFRSLPNSRAGTIITCEMVVRAFPAVLVLLLPVSIGTCLPGRYSRVASQQASPGPSLFQDTQSQKGGPCTSFMHNIEVSVALVTPYTLTGSSVVMERRIRINEITQLMRHIDCSCGGRSCG